MASAHKVASVFLRCGELIFACIVVGILGSFLHAISLANGPSDGRIVYATVTASLSILLSLCLLPPLRYSFWAFPVDIVIFIMWLVAFGLLESTAAGHSCSSSWYYNYWSFYWGRYWRTPGVRLVPAGCGEWRTLVGFSFVSAITWLLSGCLGVYAALKYRRESRGEYENGTRAPGSKENPEASPDSRQGISEA